jgi:hypothetical protein
MSRRRRGIPCSPIRRKSYTIGAVGVLPINRQTTMKSSQSKKKRARTPARPKAKKSSGRKPPTPATPQSGDGFYVAFYIASFVLCFAVFRGLTDNYLFNDDFEWIASARHNMTIGNVVAYRVIGFFRPMVNMSFYAMERIAPGNLTLYYYENILLHFVNSMLVFHLVLALVRDRVIAATTAVFFIVTSVHCAAVMWISARTTLLFMVFFLASLLVLIRPPWNRKKFALSLLLYVLALLTKETAVVGAALVAVVYVYFRGKRESSFDLKAVIAFAAVTVLYLVVRGAVIGRFVQPNWGPGVHVIRNVAGGGVYQLMPWTIDWLLALSRDLFGLGKPFLRNMLLDTGNPVWPELLILPMIAILVTLSRVVNRQREMLFALSWMFISLAPTAFLKFRFLTMNSFAHNRYYYLASIGACLAVVLSLSVLWENQRIRKYGRAVAAVLVGLLLISETHRVKFMEEKWHDATHVFRNTVTGFARLLDELPAYNTCVVEWVPMKFPYLKKAIAIERPGWELVQVKNGKEEAANYKPCVFIEFVRKGGSYSARAYSIGDPPATRDGP